MTEPAAQGAAPPDEDISVAFRLPKYVAKALKRAAVDRELTQRQIVLQGLRAVGLDVRDEDLRDRRRG
ncbi:MAG TPA: hypothetical protein VEH84_04245 [Alphaproteobacteria bacterium]|nr:hypothetical protein [Alphaproteobacteria bacterium]